MFVPVVRQHFFFRETNDSDQEAFWTRMRQILVGHRHLQQFSANPDMCGGVGQGFQKFSPTWKRLERARMLHERSSS